jgi:hypothetical protein
MSITNQLGRRYNRTKKKEGAPIGNKNATDKQLDQNEPIVSTAAKLATQHGVSEATVKRAGKLAEAVEAHPEIKEAIAGGKFFHVDNQYRTKITTKETIEEMRP